MILEAKLAFIFAFQKSIIFHAKIKAIDFYVIFAIPWKSDLIIPRLRHPIYVLFAIPWKPDLIARIALPPGRKSWKHIAHTE